MQLKFSFPVLIPLFLFLFFATAESPAQTKQRIAFKNRKAAVSGTIKGDEIRQFVFRVKKDQDIDISVVHDYHAQPVKPHPKFVVFKPDGKPLFDDQEPATDMLEVLETAGDYTIRLQLPEDMRNGGKPVRFTLRLILK